jgi:large subunit ribosomal protein L24
MKNKTKLKVGDTVKVLAGDDKGKTGEIVQILRDRNMVVVKGVNQMVKHLRSGRRDQKGQRIEFDGPVHISNVQLMDENAGASTRVKMDVVKGEDGSIQRIRTSKKSNAAI